MKDKTISTLAPLWLASRSYSPASRTLRKQQLGTLMHHVGDVRPADVDIAQLIEAWQSTEYLKPASRRSMWSAWSGFFRWAAALGLCDGNPVEAIRKPPEPDHAPNAVTLDELGRLWAIVPDGPLRLAIALAAGAGLRRGEIVGLRGCDIDRSAEPWLLTVQRKGGRRQVIPVESAWLRAELACLPTGRERLVPVTANYLTNAVRALMVKAGIEDRSLHSLRHHFAQQALKRNDVRRVQVLMGHRSLEHTARYLAV
jgi:integrase/recombinase XerC